MLAKTIVLITFSVSLSGLTAAVSIADEDTQHEEAQHHSPWALALFVGATREHDENHPTLGLDLSYHLNDNWSIGGVIERADREKSSTLAIAGIGWHPHQRMELQLGIGKKDPGEELANVARLGLTYRFSLNASWFLAPYYARDFIEHHEDEDAFGFYLGRTF